MTTLTTWRDDDATTILREISDPVEIADALSPLGVRFERHDPRILGPDATQEEILAANSELIDALMAAEGFVLVDVGQLHPRDDDEWRALAAAARAKFLNEHTHDDDEIRYFVDGSGIFYLHIDGHVHALLCTSGDLLSVPANTTHWFDMGTQPDFTAVRFFHVDDGWVGSFTGSDISQRFPDFDELAARASV